MRLSAACDDDEAETRVNYFTDATFTYDAGRKSWICADDYIFWPLFGTLDVLGYSSSDGNLNAVWNESDCSSSVTLSGFDEWVSGSDDLVAACYNEARTGSSPLRLSFDHSKALIVLKAQSNVEDTYTIKSVEFESLQTITNGSSLTVTNNRTDNVTAFEWSGLGTSYNVPFPGINDFVVPMIENEVSSILVPEQQAYSFTVKYTQSGAGEEIREMTITPKGPTWERGKRYVYKLEFNE